MNLIESLFENEDLLTDEGIEAICEKIKQKDVSDFAFSIYFVHYRNLGDNYIARFSNKT